MLKTRVISCFRKALPHTHTFKYVQILKTNYQLN